MKIQYRIAFIFSLVTISIVLMISLMEYYFANQNTFEDFFKRLEIRAIVAAKTKFEKDKMMSSAYDEIRTQHLETLPYEREYFLSVDSLEKSITSSGLDLNKPFYTEAIEKGESRYRDNSVFYLGHLYKSGNSEYIIVMSAHSEVINDYLANLKRILFASIIITIVLSLVIGVWFSKLILRPLRNINSKMHDISFNQLHIRMNEGEGKDEISQLIQTFNNMLDRLEASFETQKNFISNASHELNTPLTSIIGESEYALNKERSANEYKDSFAMVLGQAERLKKIITSLLHLAQTGYTNKNANLETLTADELIYTVKKTIDNIMPDNKAFINLDMLPEDHNKLQIRGNYHLLELALVNIVINGCKYSNNEPVEILIAAADKKVIFIVEDKGIGIPENELAYIYEPFFRASNTGRYQGYGIGLPLTRNIIRMHNGILEVSSAENKGTKIKITLPQYDSSL